MKRLVVEGSPAVESWDGQKKSGEIAVVVGGRFVVSLESSKVDDLETLRGLLLTSYGFSIFGEKAMLAATVCFLLGIVLYASAPSFAHMGSKALFVGAFCIILSMYGGGFATIPAYLADMFGTQFVGAIHGRLLNRSRADGHRQVSPTLPVSANTLLAT